MSAGGPHAQELLSRFLNDESRQEHARRLEVINDANDQVRATRPKSKCAKCGRVSDPWPLERSNTCSPKHWAKCIRRDVA